MCVFPKQRSKAALASQQRGDVKSEISQSGSSPVDVSFNARMRIRAVLILANNTGTQSVTGINSMKH